VQYYVSVSQGDIHLAKFQQEHIGDRVIKFV